MKFRRRVGRQFDSDPEFTLNSPVHASCLGGDLRATPETIAHAIRQSEAVFLGTIVAREHLRHGYHVRFSVERVFKGGPVLSSFRPRSGCEAWYWAAEVGERAIYFVYRDGQHLNVTMFRNLGANEKAVEEALRLVNEKQ